MKIQLKDERKQLRHDIDSLENRLKWLNIGGPCRSGESVSGYLARQTQTHSGKNESQNNSPSYWFWSSSSVSPALSGKKEGAGIAATLPLARNPGRSAHQ